MGPDVFAALLYILHLCASGDDSAAAVRRRRRLAGNAARNDDAHRAPHVCLDTDCALSRHFWASFSQSDCAVLVHRLALHAPALYLHALEHHVGDEHAFSDPIHLVQRMKIHR